MIHVDLPATMECEECDAHLGVKLMLTIAGTLVGKMPHGHGWQLTATENGVLVCRCPEHRTVIETQGSVSNADPAIRRIAFAGNLRGDKH